MIKPNSLTSMVLGLFFLGLGLSTHGINPRVEPPFWWAGMQNPSLQIMVYAEDISGADVLFECSGATVDYLIRTSNRNYLFINLTLHPHLKPGKYHMEFVNGGQTLFCYEYEFRERLKPSYSPITAQDAIYLIMPDRFANGNPDNDNVPGMREKANRKLPNGRHGGDLEGIRKNLGYIKDLGFTTLWINPVFENNMERYSYHGYSITDYYAVDPRLGTMDEYIALINDAHRQGMKVIKDMVLNHCGTGHWWMADLPAPDWIHQWPEFTRSNYRSSTLVDPYASKYDYVKMTKGWFDSSMPDLNQHNPLLATYLIQNTIWWIEQTGIDGIRMDTQPYPFKDFMAKWAKAVLTEYPGFFIVGEAWLNQTSMVSYYQGGAMNHDGYNSHLPSVFDFPLNVALLAAFNETDGWHQGMSRIYEVLTEDFLYADPGRLVTFLDNHDKNRFFSVVGEDIRKLKMALTVLMTTRGIPSVYYGTELLMTGWEQPEHGEIRKDFPGGWPGDKINAFESRGRTAQQNEIHNYIRQLLGLRREKPCLTQGKLTHFIPQDGIYLYFRHLPENAVMVVLNNNNTDKTLNLSRFDEVLGSYSTRIDLLTGSLLSQPDTLKIPAKSSLIIDLR